MSAIFFFWCGRWCTDTHTNKQFANLTRDKKKEITTKFLKRYCEYLYDLQNFMIVCCQEKKIKLSMKVVCFYNNRINVFDHYATDII